MGFGAPALAALAALAAIPVVIHILSRIRLRRAEFPSLRLLSVVKRERFSWLKLKELLLLVLRTLALLFLLLVPARPFMRHRLPGLGRAGDMVVVLDDSYSLAYADRWSRAVAAAGAILGEMASGQRAVLLLSSEAVGSRGEEWRRPAEAALRLDSLAASGRPSWSNTTLEPALRRATALARERQAVVFVVTDLQERCIPDTWRPQPDVPVTLLDVGAEAFDNAGVTGLTADVGFAAAGRPVRLRAELENYGRREATRTVVLSLPGRRDEKVVSIPAGGRTAVEFDAAWTDTVAGFARVELRSDSLAADNSRWLAIAPLRRVRTLVLQSERLPARYVVDALGRDSDALFDLDVAPVAEFGRFDPRDYGVVVVTDAAALGGAGWDRLAFHLQAGGAALVFAAEAPADASAGRGVLAFAGTARPDGFVTIDWADTLSPVIDGATAADLRLARFFSHARLAPGQGRVLAKLSDGQPLLLEAEQGRLVAAAFGPAPDHTDLVYKAAFVPLLHRTLAGLAGARLRLNYGIGDTARVAQPAAGPVDVVAPDRSFRVAAAAVGRPEAIVGPLAVPGEWRAGGQPFAVNVAPGEGDLARISAERCTALGYRVVTGTGGEAADLSQALLWAALVAFLLELLLLAL